jgi:HEAT repeat protein
VSRRGRLIASLGDPDERRRDDVIAFLREHPDPKLVGALIHYLRSGLEVALELIVANGADAVDKLVRSLARPKPLAVVEALGRIGEPATERLLQALDHPNRQIRLLSAFALGKSADPDIPFALTDLAESGRADPQLGIALIEWLRHNHRPAPEVLDRILDVIHRRSVPPLLNDFIAMLTVFEDPRLVPLLVAILEDRSAYRWWRTALMTLSRLNDPAAEPTLVRILGDHAAGLGMRMDAIWGLARLKSAKAIAPLEGLAAAKQERPVLPGHLPPAEARRAMERSLREQEAWKLKLMAMAALDHIRHPNQPMRPDYARMQPISSDRERA